MHARLRDDLVAQLSKVSAVRSASRAACHSACRPAFSSAVLAMRWRVVFEALEQAGQVREQLGALITEPVLSVVAFGLAAAGAYVATPRPVFVLHPGLRQRQRAGVLDVVHDRHRDAIDDRQALVRRWAAATSHAGRVARTAACSLDLGDQVAIRSCSGRAGRH